jgi:hypothetical protein
MPALRSKGDQQLEAQREQAQQAAREQPALDPLSVYLVVKAKIENGELEAAREIIARYKAGTL